MGNSIGRLRISSIDNSLNLKYFNIFNYINKYYPDVSMSITILKNNLTFFKEYDIRLNKIIILTILIKNNYYSSSLWILKPNDKSYNIVDIDFHSSKHNINQTINKFMSTAEYFVQT